MPKTEVEIDPEHGECLVRIDEIEWDLGMPSEGLLSLTLAERPHMEVRMDLEARLTPDEADEVADELKARAAEMRAKGYPA